MSKNDSVLFLFCNLNHITGSNTNLTQAFLLALQRTLAENNLMDIMPDTNYQAAIAVIDRWKKNFKDTFNQFEKSIEEPVQNFIDKLSNFDITAYEKFEKIYPSLTAGSEFNPFLGFDIAELYESVAKSLKIKGYTGLYVIYDEFSKFLEANISNASVRDVKMLQDFAEKCNRSGKLQLHLMLISHKEISNYFDKLPQQKLDGWRGVSERFKHIHLNNNFTQIYEIISSVIQKNEPIWKKFHNKHNRNFEMLLDKYKNHQVFMDSKEELQKIIKGGYPLHPISTFILPRLSEKVAQNERTLFTFLSSNGVSTLPSFLNNYNDDKFVLITPDFIYDYFEPLFRKEIYSSDIHSLYVLTSSILNQLQENSLETKIVKTISLIYILEQFERLKPTKEEIVGIFSTCYEVKEIERAIDELIDKKLVLYLKRSNNYLKLKKTSGVDIREQIHNLMAIQNFNVKTTLNSANFDDYMYPYRYNDEHEMIRYFSFEFIESSEIDSSIDWNLKSENIKADGVIYGILPNSEDYIKTLTELLKSTSRGNKRYIFVLPKHYKEINNVAAEYQAVSTLQERAEDDTILFDEYEIVREDLIEVIKSFTDIYTQPENYSSIYIHDGKILEVNRKAVLTALMSDICDEIYSKTPVVNNEVLNKSEITSTAASSRHKIISALLRSELEPHLGFKNTMQEATILRTVLVNTDVLIDDNSLPQINLNPTDENMRYLIKTIENFIIRAGRDGKLNFDELYKELTEPDYHIGLRHGLIPVYIATVIHKYRQNIIITDNLGQVPTNADTLAQIDKNPDRFSIEYLNWNPEREKYINALSEIFADYAIEADKVVNSYDYVANAMRRWFMSLPKYSKESKINPNSAKMINLLRQNIGNFDLIFKKLPELFGNNKNSIINIKIVKNFYDELISTLKKNLIDDVKSTFSKSEDMSKMSLTSIMLEWRDSLNANIFEQLFADGTDKFLNEVKNITNDEDNFVTRIAKLAIGLRIEDWNDTTRDNFKEIIKNYKQTAEAFRIDIMAETVNTSSSYQLTYTDESGNNITKRFDKVETSKRGKLLSNQINSALEAMGNSISEQEKRQVLMEILKKLC